MQCPVKLQYHSPYTPKYSLYDLLSSSMIISPPPNNFRFCCGDWLYHQSYPPPPLAMIGHHLIACNHKLLCSLISTNKRKQLCVGKQKYWPYSEKRFPCLTTLLNFWLWQHIRNFVTQVQRSTSLAPRSLRYKHTGLKAIQKAIISFKHISRMTQACAIKYSKR